MTLQKRFPEPTNLNEESFTSDLKVYPDEVERSRPSSAYRNIRPGPCLPTNFCADIRYLIFLDPSKSMSAADMQTPLSREYRRQSNPKYSIHETSDTQIGADGVSQHIDTKKGFGDFDMFGKPRKVVGDSTQTTMVEAESELNVPLYPNTDIAAEVKRRENLHNIRRAPSPPRPKICPVHFQIPTSKGGIQHNDQPKMSDPAPKDKTKKDRKHMCGSCSRYLKHSDLSDLRNQKLKRREKKCVSCWDLLESMARKGVGLSNVPRQIKLNSPAQGQPALARRSPEEAYISTVVAELLQQLAPAVVVIPNEAGVDGDWFIPQWIFEIRQEVRETKRTLS